MMFHRYELSTYRYENSSLSIRFFKSNSVSSDNSPPEGCIALDALLVHVHHLKVGVDYECADKTYVNSSDYITVHGKANIILVVDLLLNSPLFLFDQSMGQKKSFWQDELNRLIASAIEDQSLSLADLNKIKPLILKTLDNAFTVLSNENLKAHDLAKQTQASQELLKHPYYQLLGLLENDYQEQLTAYNKLGLFFRLRKPKPESIVASCAQSGLLPNCYLDRTKLPRPSNSMNQSLPHDDSVSSAPLAGH